MNLGTNVIRFIIANEIKDRAGDPPVFQVARVFCDHRLPGIHDLRDPLDIIMSLWAQLVASIPDPKFGLKYIQRMLSKRETFQSIKERWEEKMDIFEKTAAKIGSVVLIVDGLDEVPRHYQEEVVAGLREIQQRSKKCRLLITSRPYNSIMDLFHRDPSHSKFRLEANEMDLMLYITDRFSRDWATRGKQFHNQEEIIPMLVEKCDGSFLFAKLSMDEVLKANTDDECSEIINGLPKSLADIYDNNMNRLAQEHVGPQQQAGLPCIAIQALFWVAYARTPMTEPQLRQALAINKEDEDFNPRRKLWNDRGIEKLCGQLVVVDRRKEVRVAHKTITDHLLLENTRKTWFPNIREHIPSVLLSFLLFKSLRTKHGGGSLDKFMEDFPLCQYALEHWGVGLNATLKQDISIWVMAERFLKTRFHDWNEHVKELMINCLTSKCRPGNWLQINKDDVTPGQVTGMHWAVFFDLRAFVPILSHHEKQFPVSDPIPTTPLGLAAAYISESRRDVARILLENGAEVNISRHGPQLLWQPLNDAVYWFNVEVAELLLDAGADKTIRQVENDESALDLAYILGRKRVAELFASRISGNTATEQEIAFLVKGGFTADLQRAINEGLDVNQPCGNGKLALDYALEAGNEKLSEVKKVLVQAQALSNLKWPPVPINTYPYFVNFYEDSITPLDVMEKCWPEDDCVQVKDSDSPRFILLLEKAVPSHMKTPIRSIVFETVSRDQGWSTWEPEFNGTYIGSTTIRVSVKQPGGLNSPSFEIQRNLRADSRREFKLHTNIWNLSELKKSSPRKAELIESLEPGSTLQVSAHVKGGPGWANYVSFVRARLYGVEFNQTRRDTDMR